MEPPLHYTRLPNIVLGSTSLASSFGPRDPWDPSRTGRDSRGSRHTWNCGEGVGGWRGSTRVSPVPASDVVSGVVVLSVTSVAETGAGVDFLDGPGRLRGEVGGRTVHRTFKVRHKLQVTTSVTPLFVGDSSGQSVHRGVCPGVDSDPSTRMRIVRPRTEGSSWNTRVGLEGAGLLHPFRSSALLTENRKTTSPYRQWSWWRSFSPSWPTSRAKDLGTGPPSTSGS